VAKVVHPPHPATIIQARSAPPRLSARAASPPPTGLAATMLGLTAQLADDAKERAQRKKAYVQTWVEAYARRTNITDACFNHIFLGQPLDGSAIDPAHPTGFHAYTDTGQAPAGVVIINTVGKPNKFHSVNWRYTTSGGAVSKASSMFPRNLPRTKVIALILMNSLDAWVNAPDPFPPRTSTGKVVTSQMLSDVFGLSQAWSLHSPGDTVYPTSP
jgi:hypothetical protein